MSKVREYQEFLKDRLEFLGEEIRTEESMRFKEQMYTPRMDITIGPYSYEEGNKIDLINEKYKKNIEFYELLKDNSINKDYIDFNTNQNPRCLMVIEIENATIRNFKHVLGSICNAHMLAKVGVIIEYNNQKLINSLYELIKYSFVRKKTPEFIFKNVSLINKKKFDKVISDYLVE